MSQAQQQSLFPTPITVFLLDDHEIVRGGVRGLLDAEPDIEVIGEAGTAGQALALGAALRPDVAVLDVRLPDGDGITVCRELRSAMPDLACLILTSFDEDEALLDAIMAGAAGYVLKQIKGSDLVSAVRTVASGQSMLDPAATARRMSSMWSQGGADGPQQQALEALSPRERDILDLIGEGPTNRRIGKRLPLSENPAKNNVSRLPATLGVMRRVQAAVIASQTPGGVFTAAQARLRGPFGPPLGTHGPSPAGPLCHEPGVAEPEEAAMPATGLDATVLEELVAAAVAAPSIHNTQPWRFRLDPTTDTVHVRAAADRGLRHHDPTGRALHISVGAAVFNLRVAVEHFGWDPVVHLLPRPADPALLATVRPAGPRGAGRQRRHDLYDAVWRRHSSRQPFSDTAIPADHLAEIAQAASAEGTLLVFPPPAEAARVLRLTAEAELMDVTDPERGAENRAWAKEGQDGVPDAAFPVQDSEGRMPMRDFSARRPGHGHTREPFEEHPVLAVLSTGHDARADWLRAGQGLEHALLVATALGVKASMFSQATEWPELRWALRDPRRDSRHVQMLIRLGHGPDGPATPRRPVREVLEDTPGHT